MFAFCLILFALCSVLTAQSYKCDWSVNGIGGGEVTGGNYRCGATAGQTATGLMAGENLLALIGFWQAEAQVGIKEVTKWSSGKVLVTRLYIPAPNPFRTRVTIRYTLATERPTLVQVCDITGREVRRLIDSKQKPGRYHLLWDGKDSRGRRVACGVYFCRFSAGDYCATEKLILSR